MGSEAKNRGSAPPRNGCPPPEMGAPPPKPNPGYALEPYLCPHCFALIIKWPHYFICKRKTKVILSQTLASQALRLRKWAKAQ